MEKLLAMLQHVFLGVNQQLQPINNRYYPCGVSGKPTEPPTESRALGSG